MIIKDRLQYYSKCKKCKEPKQSRWPHVHLIQEGYDDGAIALYNQGTCWRCGAPNDLSFKHYCALDTNQCFLHIVRHCRACNKEPGFDRPMCKVYLNDGAISLTDLLSEIGNYLSQEDNDE